MAAKQLRNWIFCIIVVNLLIQESVRCANCPDPELLKPCTCRSVFGIECEGNQAIDVKSVFSRLSAKLPKDNKHFLKLKISNSAIEELPENTFADITFQWLHIWGADNLKRIHTNAFSGTESVTDQLFLWTSPKLESNNLFDILNKFKNSMHLSVGDINLKAIPNNAFKALEKLEILEIYGRTIESIGEKPFFELNFLKRLDLFKTSIKYIPKNVFVFSKSSKTQLKIGLFDNYYMNGSSFDTNAFTNIGRPVELDFGGNDFYTSPKQMQYIDEKIFRPFLMDSQYNNTIDMYKQKFECNNCKNYWLKSNPEFLTRIARLNCNNGNAVNSNNTFGNCK